MAHILDSFETALEELRKSVLTMGSMAQRNLEIAVRGCVERKTDLCNSAIAEEDEVNDLEMSIDQQGMEIMLRYQPVAIDLRKVLTAMKIAGNLERISDEAESIARRGRKMNKHNELDDLHLIEPIYDQARLQLADALRAYTEGDIELAVSIGKRDDELDAAHRKLVKHMTAAMAGDSEAVKDYLHAIFIIRCLERVGDHAVNIGEEAVFMESSHDIRHGNVGKLDEAD
jgi:phosphate transport system protein